ncbi:MAG: replication protein, partial [Euryarchaeota archaeon]|nr:replication protein [Euryarchaeota archaeon]
MSALFLTLTVKNCQLYELRETVRHLHRSFKRLTLIQGFPTSAWFRRTEVTLGKSLGGSGPLFAPQVHPHIHALLLVRPSYWSRDYWSQLKWQKEWQMAARLDYPPVVDIRRARPKANADGPLSTDANLAAT